MEDICYGEYSIGISRGWDWGLASFHVSSEHESIKMPLDLSTAKKLRNGLSALIEKAEDAERVVK